MNTQNFKWISTSLLALALSSSAQAWNFQPTFERGFQATFPLINCVTTPDLPVKNQETLVRITKPSEDGYREFRTTVTNVNNHQINSDVEKYTYSGLVEFDGGGLGSAVALETGTTRMLFSLTNRYMNITEHLYRADDYSFTRVNRYTPYVSTPIGKICENQTWTNDFNHSFAVTREYTTSSIHPVSSINTIEAVNIPKTVSAGTFNTYQHRIEDGDSVITQWVDIPTGITVAKERIDSRIGMLVESQELRSYHYPTTLSTPWLTPVISWEKLNENNKDLQEIRKQAEIEASNLLPF